MKVVRPAPQPKPAPTTWMSARLFEDLTSLTPRFSRLTCFTTRRTELLKIDAW